MTGEIVGPNMFLTRAYDCWFTYGARHLRVLRVLNGLVVVLTPGFEGVTFTPEFSLLSFPLSFLTMISSLSPSLTISIPTLLVLRKEASSKLLSLLQRKRLHNLSLGIGKSLNHRGYILGYWKTSCGLASKRLSGFNIEVSPGTLFVSSRV